MRRATSERAPRRFRIRAATKADAVRIARLMGDFQAEGGWPRRGAHAATRGALASGRARGLRVFLATTPRGAAVGLASAWLVHDLGDGPGAFLSDLYVVRAWRRRGVGRALVAAVARLAVENGGVWMMWHAGRKDGAARSFYASLGSHELREQSIRALTGPPLVSLAIGVKRSRLPPRARPRQAQGSLRRNPAARLAARPPALRARGRAVPSQATQAVQPPMDRGRRRRPKGAVPPRRT